MLLEREFLEENQNFQLGHNCRLHKTETFDIWHL